jgi:hypothetical protein
MTDILIIRAKFDSATEYTHWIGKGLKEYLESKGHTVKDLSDSAAKPSNVTNWLDLNNGKISKAVIALDHGSDNAFYGEKKVFFGLIEKEAKVIKPTNVERLTRGLQVYTLACSTNTPDGLGQKAIEGGCYSWLGYTEPVYAMKTQSFKDCIWSYVRTMAEGKTIEECVSILRKAYENRDSESFVYGYNLDRLLLRTYPTYNNMKIDTNNRIPKTLQLIDERGFIELEENQTTSIQTTIKNPNENVSLKNVEIIIEIPYTNEDSLVYIPDQPKRVFFDSLSPLEEKIITIELNIREIRAIDFEYGDFYSGCRLTVNHSYAEPISYIQKEVVLGSPSIRIKPISKNYVIGQIYYKTKGEQVWWIPGADISLFSNVSEGLLYDYSDDIPDGHCVSGNVGGYVVMGDDKMYKMKISCPGFYSQYRVVDLRTIDPVELDVRLYHRPPTYDGSSVYQDYSNYVIGTPHPSEDPNWVPNTDGLETPVEEEEETGWIAE